METTALTCQELVDLVTEYFEGVLPPEEQLRFEAHLALCPPCEIHLDQMRRTRALVGTLTVASIPQRTRNDLLIAFRRWKAAG